MVCKCKQHLSCTGYLTFLLVQVGIKNADAFKQAHDILIPLGKYFQVQDDYLDCYGSPEVIGKIGTDIQDNKCSWLINQALAKANPEQRKILDVSKWIISIWPAVLTAMFLQKNYGKKDSAAEAKVKQIYIDLNIEAVYKAYEEESYKEISGLIEKLDESIGLKKAIFTEFMNKIYKRTYQTIFFFPYAHIYLQ